MPFVAFQGEFGAFSEQAARSFFRKSLALHPCEHFEDVFRFVAGGRGRRGVVPIENSVFGIVHENYDLLLRYNLSIVGEVTLKVHHHLMALPGVQMRDIRFILSHPQALGQCEKFLRRLKGVRTIPCYDTAGAAKMIKEEGRTHAAALASLRAAKAYHLRILRRNVESDHHNYTRFLVLSRRPEGGAGKAKTSLVFAVQNVPGALFRALAVFALRNINLLKIESRPIAGKPGEYLFYLDIAGSEGDAKVRNGLQHLREVSTFLKVLGSYPSGRTVEG